MHKFTLAPVFALVITHVSISHAQNVSPAAVRESAYTRQQLLADLQLGDTMASRQYPAKELLAYANATGYLNAVFDYGNYNRTNFFAVLKSSPEHAAQFSNVVMKDNLAKTFFCPPYQVSRIQLAAITVQYLKSKPASWSEHGHLVVSKAYLDAFPCTADTLFPK